MLSGCSNYWPSQSTDSNRVRSGTSGNSGKYAVKYKRVCNGSKTFEIELPKEKKDAPLLAKNLNFQNNFWHLFYARGIYNSIFIAFCNTTLCLDTTPVFPNPNNYPRTTRLIHLLSYLNRKQSVFFDFHASWRELLTAYVYLVILRVNLYLFVLSAMHVQSRQQTKTVTVPVYRRKEFR